MKRCPNCNRTYDHQTQKFCTHDGGLLIDEGAGQVSGQAAPNLKETVLIDSKQLQSSQLDEPTKPISRELAAEKTGFDPFKTVLSHSADTQTWQPRPTQGLNRSQSGSEAPSTPAPPPADATVPPLATTMAPTSSPVGSDALTTPPQTSGGLPPSGQLAAKPVTTGALEPTPAQMVAPAQSGGLATPAPTAPRAKSKLPLVLGILFVLLVLGVGVAGAGYWFVGRPLLAKRRVASIKPPVVPVAEPTPNVESSPPEVRETKPAPVEPPPYTPAPNAAHFVNSTKNLDGKLAEHYVDFSFYYPKNWEKDPQAGVHGATNFAKVERRIPPDFTQESFSVGWFTTAGSPEADKAIFHTVAANLDNQYKKSFPEYQKVSEGETKVNGYDGYEFRFESLSRNTAKGDIKVWGRVILLPPPGDSKNGVVLLMLATSLAPELKSVRDVGVKGELPMMIESFRFGKK